MVDALVLSLGQHDMYVHSNFQYIFSVANKVIHASVRSSK
jgi:hypothetical protein